VERLRATVIARQHDGLAELWQLRRELEATRVALQLTQRLSERLD
jgi:hypothetical protein